MGVMRQIPFKYAFEVNLQKFEIYTGCIIHDCFNSSRYASRQFTIKSERARPNYGWE
jgi:hypothetical protein